MFHEIRRHGLLAYDPAVAARKVGEDGAEATLAGVAESDDGSSRSSPTSGSTATSYSPLAGSTPHEWRTSSAAERGEWEGRESPNVELPSTME